MFLLMEHAAFHENPFLKKNKDRQQTLQFEIFLIVKWGKFLLLLLGQWELYWQYFTLPAPIMSRSNQDFMVGYFVPPPLLVIAGASRDIYRAAGWSLFGNPSQQRSLLWRRRFQKCGQVAASNATCATPSSCNKIFITQRFFGKQQPYGRCYEHAATTAESILSDHVIWWHLLMIINWCWQ